MVGKSTSHGVDLDMQKTQTSDVYDLQNWQGLTDVLKAAKAALSDSKEYASFRNLVLQYAQNGGDVELKKQILAQIAQFSNTENKKSEEQPHSDFLPHSLSSSVEPEVVESDDSRKNSVHSEIMSLKTEDSVSVQNKVLIHPRRMAPRFAVPTATVISEVAAVSIPPTPVVEEKEAVAESFLPESEPVVLPQIEEEEVVPMVHRSIEEYKTRITEIKHLVHNHLGNPAAIIDMRSEVGKEYMKALLTALKATAPGSDANADIAMSALEASFKKLVAESESSTPAPVSTPVVEIVIPEEIIPRSVPVTAPVVEVESPVEEVFVSDEDMVPSVSNDAHKEEMPEQKVVPPPVVEKVTSEVANKYSVKNTLDQLSSYAKKQKNEVYQSELPPAVHSGTEISSRVSPQQTKYSLRGHGKTPASNMPNLEERAVMQSELVSEEITIALHGLLHDWVIFAGSGIFGTGPSGVEHPLYQKLATLSMGEVIAGRWDNSDPKITKTIKEYVDAWRHEQGIAYTVNETFEHYLRRVIQRILKRQKQ